MTTFTAQGCFAEEQRASFGTDAACHDSFSLSPVDIHGASHATQVSGQASDARSTYAAQAAHADAKVEPPKHAPGATSRTNEISTHKLTGEAPRLEARVRSQVWRQSFMRPCMLQAPSIDCDSASCRAHPHSSSYSMQTASAIHIQ